MCPQGYSVVIAEETENEIIVSTETTTLEIEEETTDVVQAPVSQSVTHVPGEVVKTGTIGTVNWTLDDANVLTLSEGTLPDDLGTWGTEFTGGSTLRAAPIVVTKVIFEGPVTAGTSLNGFFYRFSNMTEIVNLNLLDTTNTTTMSEMFSNCPRLTSLDLSNFNTSNVTDMSRMFMFLAGVTELDINHFDTSNVTNMSGMFGFAINLQTVDLSAWNTSNVTDTSGMFYMMDSLTNVNVNTWDTSSLAMAYSMFEGCQNLVSVDLSNWDVSSLTETYFMFRNCSSLTNVNLSTWNTVALEKQHEMFLNCQNLTTLDLSTWNTNNVQTASAGGVIHDTNLQSISLSPTFSFIGGTEDFGLPVPPTNAFYTGKWRHVPTQTEFTNAELDAYDGTQPGEYVWSLMKYDMIFDVNGGQGLTPAIQVDYGTLATQPANPTKAGARFVGWSTSSTGGTFWDFSNTTMPEKAVTLYAQYDQNVGGTDEVGTSQTNEAGTFWTDDCGVITDQWGNVMYKPTSCQYKVPNTGVQ